MQYSHVGRWRSRKACSALAWNRTRERMDCCSCKQLDRHFHIANADISKTLEYITKQLIDGYKSGDNLTQTFLNNYDFYIFPIVNPDGEQHYQY